MHRRTFFTGLFGGVAAASLAVVGLAPPAVAAPLPIQAPDTPQSPAAGEAEGLRTEIGWRRRRFIRRRGRRRIYIGEVETPSAAMKAI